MSIFPNATDSTVEQFYLKEDVLHTKTAIMNKPRSLRTLYT